jgi:acid ceramidase
MRPDHWQELESLARQLELPVSKAVLCNLYYDLFKFAWSRPFACTAFAVETSDGILHARNLDWWTENSALSRYTTVTRFLNAQAGDFSTVGWPGFTGVFSGVAPGRFAVTLNAVLSLEPARLATPITFLLRTALEDCLSFEAALKVLSGTPIPCDCLLLLTGIRQGELAVIERTPSRHAIRRSNSGYIGVTNSYQALDATAGAGSQSELLGTACSRLERVGELVSRTRPGDAKDCLRYLADPAVQMPITVQQMVFNTSTGEHWIT